MNDSPAQFSQPANIDLLSELIENEKCALILGPFASSVSWPDGSTASLHTLLARDIAQELCKKTGQTLPSSDDLGLVCTPWVNLPGTSRTSLEIKVRDFYRSHTEPSPLLKEVARLPFRLVFTVSPDELLQKAFLKEKKRSFRDGYYRFAKTQMDDYDETPEGWSYIYQLFGRIQEKPDGSLPLTIADQLDYIDSVQGVGKETRLPTSLRNAMQDCEAFLFLGFDYENWYLRVLFHILRFSEKARLVFGLPDGSSTKMSEATRAFFQNQFRFSFLNDNPVELLRRIHDHIEAGKAADTAPSEETGRSLLFLYAEQDEPLKEKIDKYLSSAKKKHGLTSESIHKFVPGDAELAKYSMVNAAAVIVILLSADFLADETLAGSLAERALARQSEQTVVAAIYARQVDGVTDFIQGKAPVFPAETIPLSAIPGEAGLPMVATMLEKLISAA